MMRGSLWFFLVLVFWVGGSLSWDQSSQHCPAMCFVHPLNTTICSSQVNGLICHVPSQMCIEVSCIIEGINAEGVYYSAQFLSCRKPIKACSDSEINCTASTCHALNVSSSTGVCFFPDNAQQQDSSINQKTGVFNLTVTSVIDLASTSNKSPNSAPTVSGGMTPTASPSTKNGSAGVMHIIVIGTVAGLVMLFIILFILIGCVIILLKQKREDNSALTRMTGHNIYSKLPEQSKHDNRAKPTTEPTYSTVTDALLPASASPLYSSITSPQASVHYTTIQTLPVQEPAGGDTTQPDDSQPPVYSTIIRQQDGKKVTTTILDPSHQHQNNKITSNVVAAHDQPSADTPETSETTSADSNPPEDEYYSTVVRRDGEKVTVRVPAPKNKD